MMRRVERSRGRESLVLGDELGSLLRDLRRLSRAEPAVVLEVLLVFLERLSEAAPRLEDAGGRLVDHVGVALQRIGSLLAREQRSGGERIDAPAVVRRLFELWIGDRAGQFADLDDVLFDSTSGVAEDRMLRGLLSTYIARLPLVFPPLGDGDDDLQRTLILAERHRAERLMGCVLARAGRFEYAVLVARDHYRRTGDALDLVEALKAGGDVESALVILRRALAGPRSFHRQRLQELLEQLVDDPGQRRDREARHRLETEFLDHPTQSRFRALERLAQPEQWPRHRRRLLTHLQKHQKAPTLVFMLWLEAGDLLEADGLAVTQAVDPEALETAASRVADERPDLAAGWLLTASHGRAARRRSSNDPTLVANLLEVRRLSECSNQTLPFRRALERFIARYGRRSKLMALLREAGLPPASEAP